MAQVTGEKQRKLQQASETNQRLQAKMQAFRKHQEVDRARKQQTVQQLAGQLEKEGGGDSQASKLDFILAQSVQMQTMLFAQMTSQMGAQAVAQGQQPEASQEAQQGGGASSISPADNAQMMHEMSFNDAVPIQPRVE